MSKDDQKPKVEYRTIIDKSGASYINRVLVATPTTGLVRIEWVQARYGQIIPTNWSMVQMLQFIDGYAPVGYMVADAQNLIVKNAIENDFQWLLLIEHDNILPPDAFIRFNDYMRKADVPVVSGLYYTRSRPAEPLLYRGRGTSYHTDWKMGDRVWVDGVPTGSLLIHVGLLKAMWDESPEYLVGQQVTRRVFETPERMWYDPESEKYITEVGTSDLEWCTRVIDGNYFEKSGWKEYAKKKYPFLVDTNIFVKHINPDGEQFP